MCVQMEAWASKVGKAKRRERLLPPPGLEEAVWGLVGPQLQAVYGDPKSKESRGGAEEGAKQKARRRGACSLSPSLLRCRRCAAAPGPFVSFALDSSAASSR